MKIWSVIADDISGRLVSLSICTSKFVLTEMHNLKDACNTVYKKATTLGTAYRSLYVMPPIGYPLT